VFARIWSLLGTIKSTFNTRRELALENLALRHQVGVLTRTAGDRRPRLGWWDRVLWVFLCHHWKAWRGALAIVQPTTVIRWHRETFRHFWTRKSRVRCYGRPAVDREVVSLIRKMSTSNVTWGAPRIRNELSKLGIKIAVSTVSRYMIRSLKPSSPTWRAFLENHVKDLVAFDFFAVPTATFGVLFGFLVLAHDRRRVLHFNVTSNPTAEWTARQVVQAFPDDTAPRFALRDRDRVYGEVFHRKMVILGVEEVVIAARSPWQNPYVERLIGSLRRECLDYVIVFDELHLLRVLDRYFKYYHRSRCQLSLAGDSPQPRLVQGPELGSVVELPEVGGLHHRYERAAA